jgi:hypothetical protein
METTDCVTYLHLTEDLLTLISVGISIIIWLLKIYFKNVT